MCDRRNYSMAPDLGGRSVSGVQTWELRCRAGHLNCRVPWGYDREHTDSPRPYTLDELAERTEPPHRYAYPSASEYLFAFKLWRSLRRDAQLTFGEEAVVRQWRIAELAKRLGVPEPLDAN